MVITIYHLNTAMQDPDVFVYDLSQQFFQEMMLVVLMISFLLVNTVMMMAKLVLVAAKRRKTNTEHYLYIDNLNPNRVTISKDK